MEVQVDESDIRVLEETLTKVGRLTDQITSSLHQLELSGTKAENALRPIEGKTRMMAIYGRNLDASLAVIEGVKEYALLTEDCESIIRAGPKVIGVAGYYNAIVKLSTALQELRGSQLRTFYKVIDKAEQLVKQGQSSLKSYYQSIVESCFAPIDPNQYLNKPSEKSDLPFITAFPTLSSENISIFRDLYKVFADLKMVVDDIYFDKCANYINASVSSLELGTKPITRSGSINSGVNGASGGPQSLTKTSPLYERGSNGIHAYSAALKGLLLAQANNTSQLFGDKEQTMQFYNEEIVSRTTSHYVAIVGTINDHVLKNIATDSLLAFEAVDCTGSLISTVSMVSKRVPGTLSQAMEKSQKITHMIFTEFIKYIENRVNSLTTLPSDNGVCDTTIDVMSRMRRLADYKNSALISISSMEVSSWIPNKPAWVTVLGPTTYSSSVKTQPVEKLSAFFSDAIDALFISLELKAKALAKKSTQIGYFLLTNLTLIERYVTKSDIYKILGASGAERLERLRKRGLNMFLEGWKAAAALLMDVTILPRSTTGKPQQLSGKDREAIKEKFRNFNTEFETLVQRHKSYNITDPSLRQLLAKEVGFISPLYHRFYDRHRGGDFSKNVEKQFDRIIESLG